jgi:hypothetical protein
MVRELGPHRQKARTDNNRTDPQRHSSPRVRLPQLWEAVHPAVSADGPPTCPHWREAPYVRALWKGMSFNLETVHPMTDSDSSLSVIRVLLRDIVASTLESDHTSAHMPTARRRLRVAPP